MKYRALFLSDIHLRTKWCQARRLLSFLLDTEAEYLYLVGDILDNWNREVWYMDQNQLDCIAELSNRQRFANITYINGNHDLAEINGEMYHIHDMFGVFPVERAVHTSLKDEDILVIHGHQFDIKLLQFFQHEISLYRWMYAKLTTREKTWWFSKLEQMLTNLLHSGLSKFTQRALHYANKHDYATIITGHTHHPLVARSRGSTFYNTGDFVTNCTMLVETLEGEWNLLYEENLHHLHQGRRRTLGHGQGIGGSACY